MASVALCPRCSHDLLVPDSTDPDAWAQCSACNVLFQVRDAISRDVAELRLVEPVPEPVEAEYAKAPLELAHDELHLPKPTPTIDISSQKTLDDIGSLGGSDDLKLDVSVGDEDMPTTSPRRSAPTVDDLAKSSAPTWEDAPAEHVVQHAEVEPPIEADVDLASTRTIAEIPDLPPYSPPIAPARAGATIEFGGDPSEETNTEFELEASSEPSLPVEPLAPWDDSEHMERLLNGDDAPANDEAPMPASLDIQTGTDESAVTEPPVINADMFVGGPTAPRRYRRRSPVRMLTGIVFSGIVGLALGYVILLWMLGPSIDFLHIAHYLPSAILPASFSSTPFEVADEPSPNIDRETKPAGFDAPAESAKSMADEVAALTTEEPPKFEPSEAAPLAGSDVARVTDAPTRTADELAMSLKTAQEARAGLMEGNLADGKAVQHAKGYSYSMLCELADRLTFVDTTSRPEFVAAVVQAADDLFRTTLADTHTRGEVARIVPLWIASKTRKHGGVFFAGTISGPSQKGSVVECQVNLGSGKTLAVLVPKQMSDGLDQLSGPVGIIGSIVDSPAQHVAGYEGDATQAVWLGHLIPLQ